MWKICYSKRKWKIYEKRWNLSKKFNLCTKEDQEWVLAYLSTGKGMIPYEMLTRWNSLDISPEDGNIFLPHHFYLSLKDNVMTTEEYKSVKKNNKQWN